MNLKKWLPAAASLAAVILQLAVVYNGKHPLAVENYYLYFSIILGVAAVMCAIIGTLNKGFGKIWLYKAPFWTGIVTFLIILNLLTEKFCILPAIYFPSPSRILEAMITDRALLLKCLGYSARLLLTGFFGGAIVGVLTGIAIGFSKTADYWISPIIRILGPIPSTAWIPLVLISFPSAVSASAFLIGLAVWFPTTVMTSSGIKNISNSLFEVSSTLGAGHWYQIFKVGVPSAMPSMFIGLFNGICSSFITLMTAEMIGAKYGIGWYVNWQKEMMSYSNVYAGLLIIAVLCSCLITLLFKLRDRVLVWQKGVIKW